MKKADIDRLDKSIRAKLKKQDLKNKDNNFLQFYEDDDNDFNNDLSDLLDYTDLNNTCTMYELSFNNSELCSSYLKLFTKEEFEFILFDGCQNSIITNVSNTTEENKYLKSLGYEPVSSYIGHSGTINTYIFVNPEYKPRVRKTSK